MSKDAIHRVSSAWRLYRLIFFQTLAILRGALPFTGMGRSLSTNGVRYVDSLSAVNNHGEKVQIDGNRGSSALIGSTASKWTQWLLITHRFLLAVLAIVLGFCTGSAQAQTNQYAYDANGRIVAVTQGNGSGTQYVYDALGHLSQANALIPGKLAIFAFMPTHGSTGTQVVIEGQGFSGTTVSANTVLFNGTPAAILSASAAQLVTTVPSNATTGPITVTVGGQNVTSATPFIVDDGGMAPIITQVTPAVVANGGAVTVTGAHLNPVPGATAVQMGSTQVVPSAISDSQLQFAVSSNITSGYVTVQTPYGIASSATDVVVLPSGISASTIVSSSYAAIGGSPAPVTIGSGGQVGVVAFSGSNGGFLSLQVTGIVTSANTIHYTVYGPGNSVVLSGTISASSPSIHIPELTASGDYLAVFQPDTAGAQFNVAVQADLQLTASAQPQAIATAWQTDRMYIQALHGGDLELTLTGVTGSNLSVSVTDASGNSVVSTTCFPSAPSGSCRVSLWHLAAGTYSVLVTPASGGKGSFNAIAMADLVGPVLTPGTTAPISLTAGQVERVSFNGVAGTAPTLQLSNVSTVPSGQNVYVLLYPPGTITTGTPYYSYFSTATSTTVNLPQLPTTGVYTAVVYTAYGTPGSAQFTLASPLTGVLSENGAAQQYVDNVAQQNAYLTFAANAGDNLELTLTNVQGAPLSVSVTNASGASVGSLSCALANPGGTCRVSLWNLAAGTYSIAVAPNSSAIASFGILLQSDIVGPAMTLNAPYQVNLGMGQVERLAFSGTAGGNLAFQLSSVQTTPAGQNMGVLIYPPGPIATNTSPYASFNTATTWATNLVNLPTTGTYTAVVYTLYGEPGSAQATLISQSTSVLSENGAAQSVITNSLGAATLTFAANAGDNLELTLNDVSGGPVAATITNSAGVQIGSLTGCSTSCRVSLWNAAADSYSIAVTSSSGSVASFGALLETDIVGPTLVANSPIAISLGAGQVERLTFTANAGQSIALQLTGAATSPAGNTVSVLIYEPGAITTSNAYTNYSVSSAGTLNLTNLPISGTYTVLVYTGYGEPGSVQVTLSP